MSYLFLDTTNGLTIGLLDRELSWIEYIYSDHKKPSELIHKLIQELCLKWNIDYSKSTLISIAGPGSYTGMRLSEGVAQISKICGMKVYSFFHFEVPALMGIDHGCFYANAFKGQLFKYSWAKATNSIALIDSKKPSEDFFYSAEVFNGENFQLTSELIKNNPQKIFERVISRGEFFPAYYFRSLDEEFKV